MPPPNARFRLESGPPAPKEPGSDFPGPLSFSLSGFTLLELITVITLLGLVLGRALPAVHQLQDRMAVVAAREATVGLFHRVRMEAVARGGATLVFAAQPAGAILSADGVSLDVENLAGEYGVALGLSRGRPTVTLVFDPLGLGRMTGQTLRFTRGEVVRELVVSSYGRVTRR